jgi:hypothetical protein
MLPGREAGVKLEDSFLRRVERRLFWRRVQLLRVGNGHG